MHIILSYIFSNSFISYGSYYSPYKFFLIFGQHIGLKFEPLTLGNLKILGYLHMLETFLLRLEASLEPFEGVVVRVHGGLYLLAGHTGVTI